MSEATGRREPTPSQTAGPFLAIGLTPLAADELVAPGAPGAVRINGRLLDGDGAPVQDGAVEIWQADPAGRYPGGATEWSGFGRCLTGTDGGFAFVTVKPGATATADGRRQAPHLDVHVVARGLLRGLFTRCYFPDEEEANAADPVLAALDPERRATLIARVENDALVFDIHLQGAAETVFFAERGGAG
jgi:protocatechuate 3,4-dioxygenase, alpha subunit